MSGFRYKDVYIEKGKRVLEVNILPEKQCNFDCIFCPIGRSKEKVETQKHFEQLENALEELEDKIEATGAELIFINSAGEALVNEQIEQVIKTAQAKGVPVRLLSNGYLLGKAGYMNIANQCEEVIGEIKVITEADFQKVQRPIEGYTIKEYIANMAAFNRQYKGRFIFEVTIIKGYNEDKASVEQIKEIIKEISPDEVVVVRMDDEKFSKKLGITDERFEETKDQLLNG